MYFKKGLDPIDKCRGGFEFPNVKNFSDFPPKRNIDMI